MAFEGLTEKISATFKKLRGKGRLKEADVKEAMREIRMALLEADVSYKVVKDFAKSVTERCIGADVLDSPDSCPDDREDRQRGAYASSWAATAKHDQHHPQRPDGVSCWCGLQGAGKTTNGSKLAGLHEAAGQEPAAGCLRHLPSRRHPAVEGRAAKSWAFPCLKRATQDPVQTAKEAVLYARQHGHDMVFLDTAGRSARRRGADGRAEKHQGHRQARTRFMLVVDAMTGQDAVNVAQSFNE